MKARPIIFGPDMIRALLDGRKTQTRRVVKPQPAGAWAAPGKTAWPYGQPGDLLWVRETWGMSWKDGPGGFPVYRAAGERARVWLENGRWRSPIYMPRRFSRITLRLTDVRVERVQDISEEDARAEGVYHPKGLDGIHRLVFSDVWDAINAKRGHGWDANPWVWALTFDVIEKNVNEVLADV